MGRNRVIAGCVTAVLAAATASLVQVNPAVADTADSSSDAVRYRRVIVQNVRSHLVITVKNASKSSGAVVFQYPYTDNGWDNDVILLEIEPNRAMRLKPLHAFTNDSNPHNDQCLAVENASLDNNAEVIQATCTYDSWNNDVWSSEAFSNGDIYINQRSHLCLVVKNASLDAGALLIQYECNGTANGRWGYPA